MSSHPTRSSLAQAPAGAERSAAISLYRPNGPDTAPIRPDLAGSWHSGDHDGPSDDGSGVVRHGSAGRRGSGGAGAAPGRRGAGGSVGVGGRGTVLELVGAGRGVARAPRVAREWCWEGTGGAW